MTSRIFDFFSRVESSRSTDSVVQPAVYTALDPQMHVPGGILPRNNVASYDVTDTESSVIVRTISVWREIP